MHPTDQTKIDRWVPTQLLATRKPFSQLQGSAGNRLDVSVSDFPFKDAEHTGSPANRASFAHHSRGPTWTQKTGQLRWMKRNWQRWSGKESSCACFSFCFLSSRALGPTEFNRFAFKVNLDVHEGRIKLNSTTSRSCFSMHCTVCGSTIIS